MKIKRNTAPESAINSHCEKSTSIKQIHDINLNIQLEYSDTVPVDSDRTVITNQNVNQPAAKPEYHVWGGA